MISEELFFELDDVLRRKKFAEYLDDGERSTFLDDISKVAIRIDVAEVIRICRDPKDDMLLELAVAGNADFLITAIKIYWF